MLNVNVDTSEQKTPQIYPCLMRGKSGVVWLMQRHKKGMVISGCTLLPTAHTSDDLDMDMMDPFYGSVTLTETA